MGQAKEVAQLSAVLGRAFPFSLLAAVSGRDVADLSEHVDRLVAAEILYQRGSPPDASLTFKHALIQDAAYESLLHRARRKHHLRVAEVIMEQFPEVQSKRPELLGHHLTRGGSFEAGAEWWGRAGHLALQRSANQEAANYFNDGLAALDRTPASLNRDRAEIGLHIALGGALSTTLGYAAPNVAKAYGRAQELCEKIGETPQLFWILWGLWTYHVVRANLAEAMELGQRLKRFAQLGDEVTMEIEAHVCVGLTHYFRGELEGAATHLWEAMEMERTRKAAQAPNEPMPSSHPTGAGHERVANRACLGLVLWHLGYPDQAMDQLQSSIDVAKESGLPFSLAWTLTWAARLHQSCRNPEPTQRCAMEVIELSEKHRFFWAVQGLFFLGCSSVELVRDQGNDGAETLRGGIAQMQQGLEAYRMAGARLSQTYMLAQLAEAYLASGERQKARDTVTEAFAAMEETGERYWEAELHRLSGEIALALHDNTFDSAAAFARATSVSKHQGCRAFELRALTSELKAASAQESDTSSHENALREVVGWFTEGTTTKDHVEARSLLSPR